MATSVPAPMAMPTSARARAGASFTPSPTIATDRPRSCSSATARSLSSGSTSANTSSMPRSAATASATWRASPVIITTLIPSDFNAATASRASGLHLVLQGEGADHVGASHEVEDGRTPRLPVGDRVGQARGGTTAPRSRSRAGPPTA